MKKILETISKYNKFLITAHVNLEGDALGSQLAMAELIRSLGKEAIVVDSDPVPDHLKFLPGAEEVSNNVTSELDFDAALILDCPTMKRTGKVEQAIKSKGVPIINIDHHISNEKFGIVNWIDAEASSAGEMVFQLYKEAGIPITKEVALSLYIAILTDTGSFNYDNTSRVTHEIAGELLGYGLDPANVSESVYERRAVSDIKLLGKVLSTIQVNKTGEIAYLEVTAKILNETGADLSKSEGLVNYARSIDNVKVAMIFKEDTKKPGKINISFRSKGDMDVNKIAASFGGGGHTRASGCTVDGPLHEVRRKVLAKVEEELKKSS